MKVELSIADDRELRAAVRDLIKGEIVGIARGEIKTILAEVVKEGVLPKDEASLNAIVKNAIAETVKNELGTHSYNSPGVIREMAREEVNRYVREWFKTNTAV